MSGALTLYLQIISPIGYNELGFGVFVLAETIETSMNGVEINAGYMYVCRN